MRKNICLSLLVTAFLVTGAMAQKDSFPNIMHLQNTALLRPNPYITLPFGTIKPNGWLYTQLQNAPIIIKTKGKKVPGWKMYNGDAGPLPYSTLGYTAKEKVEDIILIAYGCTTLRISQFPVAH